MYFHEYSQCMNIYNNSIVSTFEIPLGQFFIQHFNLDKNKYIELWQETNNEAAHKLIIKEFLCH